MDDTDSLSRESRYPPRGSTQPMGAHPTVSEWYLTLAAKPLARKRSLKVSIELPLKVSPMRRFWGRCAPPVYLLQVNRKCVKANLTLAAGTCTAGGRKQREIFSGQCVDAKGNQWPGEHNICGIGIRAMRSKLHNSLNAQGNSQQAGLPTLSFASFLLS